MEIVIDIPKYVYDTIVANNGYIADCDNEKVGMAVRKGTPLPKCHGRLIDADRLLDENIDTFSYQTESKLKFAPTIIEADRGVRANEQRCFYKR